MININHLTYQYLDNQPVLSNLNLKLARNDKISIIGRSGCGKTTLLLLLAGLLKPTDGEIEIDGEPLHDVRSKTGIIFQTGGLFPWKTVYGNCALGLKARNISKKHIDLKINQVLDQLEISHLKNKYIKDLSGGEKQRAAIARTLVLDSDILLFDEPSSSLDAFTKENFQDLLLNIYKQYELCSVIVTHDIEEAVYLGQKIIVMKDGQIVEEINNDSLFGDKDARKSIAFYEKCIEVRKRLE
ncbi:ATP-binding cassette domain-containing protein [Mycoplasmatota bacterium]|nr:ATP-binding cassette domain-containing protein [Mycoplasmatota bacterium]